MNLCNVKWCFLSGTACIWHLLMPTLCRSVVAPGDSWAMSSNWFMPVEMIGFQLEEFNFCLISWERAVFCKLQVGCHMLVQSWEQNGSKMEGFRVVLLEGSNHDRPFVQTPTGHDINPWWIAWMALIVLLQGSVLVEPFGSRYSCWCSLTFKTNSYVVSDKGNPLWQDNAPTNTTQAQDEQWWRAHRFPMGSKFPRSQLDWT